MIAAALGIAGGALAATGLIGGASEDSPDPISVDYPAPDPVETEMVKLQLDNSIRLLGTIQDPALKEEILSMLPVASMSESDRKRFDTFYTSVKKQQASIATNQASKATGQDIDSMVERGALSSEAAQQMKLRNQAAMTAILKVYNKRAEASQIARSRQAYVNDASMGLSTADILTKVDEANQSLFRQATESGLNYFESRRENITGLENAVAKANAGVEIASNEAQADLVVGGLTSGIKSAADVWANKRYLDELKKVRGI
jgi:hypothetical protein